MRKLGIVDLLAQASKLKTTTNVNCRHWWETDLRQGFCFSFGLVAFAIAKIRKGGGGQFYATLTFQTKFSLNKKFRIRGVPRPPFLRTNFFLAKMYDEKIRHESVKKATLW